MCAQNRAVPPGASSSRGRNAIGHSLVHCPNLGDLPIATTECPSHFLTISVGSLFGYSDSDSLLADAWCCIAVIADRRTTLRLPEHFLVADMSRCRLAEFSTGRYCARHALDRLGCSDAAILADQYGAPIWPIGYVGSISHCSSLAVAVAAKWSAGKFLGVDIEDTSDIEDKVMALVSSPKELEELSLRQSRCPSAAWKTILFSAKESVFKAIFTATGWAASFRDISVTTDVSGAFCATWNFDDTTVRRSLLLAGRWLMYKRQVLTLAWLET